MLTQHTSDLGHDAVGKNTFPGPQDETELTGGWQTPFLLMQSSVPFPKVFILPANIIMSTINTIMTNAAMTTVCSVRLSPFLDVNL